MTVGSSGNYLTIGNPTIGAFTFVATTAPSGLLVTDSSWLVTPAGLCFLRLNFIWDVSGSGSTGFDLPISDIPLPRIPSFTPNPPAVITPVVSGDITGINTGGTIGGAGTATLCLSPGVADTWTLVARHSTLSVKQYTVNLIYEVR